MKKYVTPKMDIQIFSTSDIITLSITKFEGLFKSEGGDSSYEDNGMDI